MSLPEGSDASPRRSPLVPQISSPVRSDSPWRAGSPGRAESPWRAGSPSRYRQGAYTGFASPLGRLPWASQNLSKSLGGSMRQGDQFGTPSYPSPLDRIRSGKREKAAQFGLSQSFNASLDLNKSFPTTADVKYRKEDEAAKEQVCTLEKFKGDGLDTFSFSAGLSKGSFAPAPTSQLNASLGQSWSFYNFVGGGQMGATFPTTVRNPNKAILTIEARTTKILVANEMACELFCYSTNELVGMKMSSLLSVNDRKQPEALCEQHLEDNGEVVIVSGKVFDAVDANGLVIPISLWMKKLTSDENPRCLVVMEPVERSSAKLSFDSKGYIVEADQQFAYLHGFTSNTEVIGIPIKQLIPSIQLPPSGAKLPKEVKKQRITGRTKDGVSFPISLLIKNQTSPSIPEDEGQRDSNRLQEDLDEYQSCGVVYQASMWVFTNISGMVSFNQDGTIHSVNNNFSLMMSGYSHQELVGQHITFLVPEFYEHLDLIDDGSMPLPPFDDDDDEFIPYPSRPSSEPLMRPESWQAKQDHVMRQVSLDPSAFTSSAYNPIAAQLADQHQGKTDNLPKQSTSLSSGISDPGKGSSDGRADIRGLVLPDLVLDRPSTADLLNEAERLFETVDKANRGSQRTFSSSTNELLESAPSCVDDCKSEDGIESPRRFLGVSPPGSSHASMEVNCSGTPDGLSDISSLGFESSERGSVSEEIVPGEGPLGEDFLRKRNSNADLTTQKGCNLTAQKLQEHVRLGEKLRVMDWEKEKEDEGGESGVASEGQGSSGVASDGLASSGEAPTPDDATEPQIIDNSSSTIESKHDQDEVLTSPCVPSLKILAERNVDSEPVSPLQLLDDNSVHSDDEEAVITARRVSSGSGGSQPKPACKFLEKSVSFEEGHSEIRTEKWTGGKLDATPPSVPREAWGFSEADTDKAVNNNVNINNSNLFGDVVKTPEDRIEGEFLNLASSTPASKVMRQTSVMSLPPIPEGSFMGQCKHRDGSYLGIIFQIKIVQLEDDAVLYCMWMSRDPSDPGEGGRCTSNLTLASSFSSTFNASVTGVSLGEVIAAKANNLSTSSCPEEEDISLSRGAYEEKYTTLQSIGKGAFGFVKMATRKQDGTLVIVKFIRKKKILKENWLNDAEFGRVPSEIVMLLRFSHPNIVKVYEFTENEEFFQMIMEKHGSGIDLFEFIDRQPILDEALASYMFRQVVAAVSYIHDKNILHRDIKDENLILDERFHIKLIDFGSAAPMEPGKLFSTFCGTLEYCSPEVLLGNNYKGPELELWAIGVTLYTLIFQENPFYDAEEIIQAILKPPFPVSNDLMQLVAWLLHPEPEWRCTLRDMQSHAWITQAVDITKYSWESVLPPEGESREIYDSSPPPSDRECSDPDDESANLVRLRDEYERQLSLSM
ncbi:PAS domain-containing serine/threonine-protein kinase-like isoform X2 [Asterias amurensis]|uniref:PAS domain-containing serine/threonine-protein kinase-like isoform X2 n=1 Tax=Asterias amurensis TaxID=7602 RepID=UPI003AB4AC16